MTQRIVTVSADEFDRALLTSPVPFAIKRSSGFIARFCRRLVRRVA